MENNPLESPDDLSWIESALIKKRGYVFKIPTPHSKVIVLTSGGIDTTVTMGLLLQEYKLDIIPIYIDISRDNRVELLSSAKGIVQYYKKKYPGRVDNLVMLTSQFPPKQILHDVVSNCWKIVDEKTGKIQGLPFELDTFAYAIIAFIQNSRVYTQIRDIYFAVHAGDTLVHQHHTLTAFRSLMLHVCISLGDFSYQITSLPIEKELELFLDKQDILKISKQIDAPLHLTRTCRNISKFPCGRCALCAIRKEEFTKARITDHTIYEQQRTDFFDLVKRAYRKLL